MGKNIPGSLELNWVVLEPISKFHISNRSWYIEIDCFHGLSTKWGQKWKTSYELTFGSGERVWELISKFHIKCWLWYIKIDRFHGPSMKSAQKWKKLYELTFGSGEPFWKLISKFNIKYWLWYIKIDRFHGLSIKWVQKWKNRTGSLLTQVSHQIRRATSSCKNVFYKI